MKILLLSHMRRHIHIGYFLIFLFHVVIIFQCAAQIAGLSSRETVLVDSLIAVYMSKNMVPGASVAVVKNKRIVWQRGYGMANLEQFIPATPATIYRLASVSKPITAVAVMQLVEQGKIALDSPIQKYVPSFPQKKYPITTRLLLSHLSGIRHYNADEFSINRPYKSLTEALDIFKKDTLSHKPGEAQTYSTYGYTLLGVIIESVSGQTFIDYLNEHVFKPAGMIHTSADNPLKIIHNRSAPYDTIRTGEVGNSVAVNSSYKIPGGGLISNVEDMCLFMIALQQDRLLKPSTWKQMITEVKTTKGIPTQYGFGWILGIPVAEGFPRLPPVVWHGGVQQGSTTAIMLVPDKDLAIVVLSNLGKLGNEITATISWIASFLSK